MTKPRNVTLFIPSLATGGAERGTLNLASALANMNYSVTVLVQRLQGKLINEIPENVTLHSLDCKRSLASVLTLTRYIKRTRPDVFIANLGHVNIVSLWARALARSSTRMIVCQHTMLSSEAKAHKIWQYKILPFLYRVFLPWADGIVSVSQTVADDLAKCASLPARKITTIYNPVIGQDFKKKITAPNPHPWFAPNQPPVVVGASRLVKEKDSATLIKAFALARRTQDLRLVILGEGPLRDELQNLINELGLTDYAFLAGFQANPIPYMRDAAVVVLSSRFEGLSNVLIETLACGTNIISTDCPGGQTEVLDNNRYGTLVPVGDAEVMARAILETIKHPKDKALLLQRGREYTCERAANQYIKLFDAARE